jgi:hypothetical protein
MTLPLLLLMHTWSGTDLAVATTMATRFGPCGPVAVAGISLGVLPSTWLEPAQTLLFRAAERTLRRFG